MRPSYFLLAVTSCFVAYSSISQAGSVHLDTFDCGQNKITLGMTTAQLKAQCDPIKKPSFIKKKNRPSPNAADKVDAFEQWLYKAKGRDDTYVLLKNGKVVRIFSTKK